MAGSAAVSMIYPLKETKVLTNGKDNTGAIGHDLLNDPNRVAIAIATVRFPKP
ncbi:hypothetical protein T484DRAFT_1861136 [Baffinella frigidus]|nr:hypothetical protein T484DRAFT_1861136 [Cryptophyta sp. CCMP2293]